MMNNGPSLDLNTLREDTWEAESSASAQSAAGAFAQVYGATLDSVSGDQYGLPGSLGAPIKEFCWRCERTANNGVKSLQVALGAPQNVPVADRQTGELRRGRAYPQLDSALAHTVLGRVEGDINGLEQDAQSLQGEAARLVAAVYRASAETDLPRYGASETRQAELKADMTQLLEAAKGSQARQVEAIDLINRLVAANDDEALAVLLGARMEMTRRRLELDDDLLARMVFKARLEKVGGDPYALGAPKYARFLAAQWDQNTSLGAVALRAAARLRQAHAYTKSRAGR